MTDMDVRIVTLPAMRVAVFHATGKEPEGIAWTKLKAWAKPKGLMNPGSSTRIFGFNNPNPTPGKAEYGYEVWLTLDPDFEPESEIPVKEFPGGHYAVSRVRGVENITDAWIKLKAWCQANGHPCGNYQWLEASVSLKDVTEDELQLDLHYPIER